MCFSEKLQAIYDRYRPNRYRIKKYLIRDKRKHPLAIICPGGAYEKVSSFVEGRPIASDLNKRGYHAVVVYYRIKEKAIFPNPHNDLKRAVSCILSHADEWNIEKDGWSLWGSSAGGHLASSYCMDMFEAPKPAALILSYPVITMGEHTHERSRNKLLGKKPDSSLIELLSVENHITSHYPPTYLWYGTADASVDPQNSRMMDAALERAGVPHETEGFAEIGHGVGLAKGTDAEKWLDHAIAFWEKQRKK